MGRGLKESEISNYIEACNKTVLLAIKAQMKFGQFVTDEVIEYATSLFLDLKLNVTKDNMSDILVEYCIRDGAYLPITPRTIETIAVWYIQEFSYFSEKYTKLGVTDVTWLNVMLNRICKKDFTRAQVYRIIDESPYVSPEQLFSKATGVKVIGHYLENM